MSNTGQDSGSLTLSAVMIVKDEAKNLTRCLASIRAFVDEIIIVDTGSKDDTIEIAKSFGAKVYEHLWENDFSLHRNQALSYCTTDWAFIIDADEELILQQNITKKTFKHWLQINLVPKDIISVAIKVEDMQSGRCVMEFNSTRFFKTTKVYYEGIVHNAPQLRSKLGACFNDTITIKHYGYDLTPEGKRKKFERTNGLLQKRLENDPKDWLVYFYLCQIYADLGKVEKALEYGEIYLTHKEELRPHKNFNTSIYFTLIHNYIRSNNKKRAEELIQEGLIEIPNDLDLSLATAEYGVWTKGLDYLSAGSLKYLRLFNTFQKDPAAKKNRFVYTNNINSLASILYYMSCSFITEGAKYLDILLNQVLPHTEAKIRDQFTKDVMSTLTRTNITQQEGSSKSVKQSPIKQLPIKQLTAVGGQK